MTIQSNYVRHLARASVDVAFLAGAGLGLSACNTFHGTKKDLSNARRQLGTQLTRRGRRWAALLTLP
jgi:hypothetical protein